MVHSYHDSPEYAHYPAVSKQSMSGAYNEAEFCILVLYMSHCVVNVQYTATGLEGAIFEVFLRVGREFSSEKNLYPCPLGFWAWSGGGVVTFFRVRNLEQFSCLAPQPWLCNPDNIKIFKDNSSSVI